MVTRRAIQITLRVYEAEADRLDAIAAAMGGKVTKATTAEAVRYVLKHGYNRAENDLGIKHSETQAKPKMSRGK
jgi:hypothetical protein